MDPYSGNLLIRNLRNSKRRTMKHKKACHLLVTYIVDTRSGNLLIRNLRNSKRKTMKHI